MNDINGIRLFSDEIEAELKDTWKILARCKGKIKDENFGQDIVSFQYKLTCILFKITEKYHILSYAKKDLLKQQKKIGAKDFFAKKKQITMLIDLLNHLLVIGKSLGDAFAWIFYKNERDHINEHLKQPVQSLVLPRKIGGLGEREFIKNVKTISGNFVLYHGITNFLRLGDVSLIDLKDLKLIGIGELKSGKLDENTLRLNLKVIGRKENKITPDLPISTFDEPPFVFPNPERYKKQIDKIVDSFKSTDNKQEEVDCFFHQAKPAFEEINDIVNSVNDSVLYKKINEGLILGCLHTEGKSIFEKWFNRESHRKTITDGDEEMKNVVASILTPETEKNNLVMGTIHFNSKQRIVMQLGTKPLFWNEIDINVLEKIYFTDVVLFSIYNTAFLMDGLEVLGYKYEYDKEFDQKLLIKKTIKGVVKITGINYFVRLIVDHLQDESVVIKSITEATQRIEKKKLDTGENTKSDIQLFLG